jgi:molybdopterin-guanine dinucleotide biosynthesis protein MobB
MKVIHFAGFSNSGKTTFISSLLPELEKLGPVAVVKHIGHHGYSLAEGKDTSRFFEAGAKASVGIDAYKSVMILQENQLESILEMLCDSGAQYAVVEGFKEKPYPKVVIGNVPGASNVILEDPSVEDVLAHLSEFSDLVTPEGFSKEIQKSCVPGITTLVFTMAIPGSILNEQINELKGELDEKIRELGDVSVRIECSENTDTRTPQKLIIGVCSSDPLVAIEATSVATEVLYSFITGRQGVIR